LNEVPIASGTYYNIDVVKSGMKRIFEAVVDLCERGYDLDIKMGVARFQAYGKTMECTFDDAFTAESYVPAKPMNKSAGVPQGTKLSDTWKKASYSEAMAGFIALDDQQERNVHATRIATRNLQVMSKDLTSCK